MAPSLPQRRRWCQMPELVPAWRRATYCQSLISGVFPLLMVHLTGAAAVVATVPLVQQEVLQPCAL